MDRQDGDLRQSCLRRHRAGNLTKGYRTRNNKRTQVMIVSRRKK